MNPIEPDEHLRAALRHAPDAEVAPPHHLSAQIIAAAHRSTAAQGAAPARRGWLAWSPRHWGASGALATLLLAGLVPLLWQTELPGPGTESRETVAAAPQPLSAVAPAAVPEPVSRDAAAKPAAPAAARAARRQERDSGAPTAAPAPLQQALESTPPVPSPTALPAPPPLQQPSRVEPPEQRAAPAGERAPQRESEHAAPMWPGAVAPQAALGAAKQAQRAMSGAARDAATSMSAPPWQGLAGSTVDADTLRAPDAAWLERLARLAQQGWHTTQPAAPAPAAALLQWQQPGQTVGRLWLEEDGALWCAAAAPCLRAPMAPQALRALVAELAR